MSFSAAGSNFHCRDCETQITIDAYRRFALCVVCEAAKAATMLPWAPPKWLDREAG